jgi:ankyrin repeat protein
MLEATDHADQATKARWDLAEAVYHDDPVQVIIHTARCQGMPRTQLFAKCNNPQDASADIDLQKTKEIDGLLQYQIHRWKYSHVMISVLIVCADIGRLEAVKELLECLYEVVTQSSEFNNPFNSALHGACSNGHLEVAEVLLLDPRFSFHDQQFNETLKVAAKNGRCDVVDLLVRDDRVNPGFDKTFAFKYYCGAGDIGRVQELQADPELAEMHSAVKLACLFGRESIVELLLADPRVDPSAKENEAIRVTCCNGNEGVAELLLADPRVDPSDKENEAIRQACLYGHTGAIQLLLADPRVDPSARDNEALRNACCRCHDDVVKLLLADPRVDPSAQEYEAIRHACRNGHEAMVKLLLVDPRVDPSVLEDEPVRHASANGRVNVVKLLLADPRVDPSAQEDMAIRIASRNGHVNVVKLLLADPRVDPSSQANEAIRSACHNGCEDVVRLLLLVLQPKLVVMRNLLMAAEYGDQVSVICLLLEKQPQVMFHDLECRPGGALQRVLHDWEVRSALTLLLATERRSHEGMRLSDVLREVVEVYARM